MRERPTIGIVTALGPVTYGLWSVQAMLLSVAYVRPVQRAGALVVMIPPDPETAADPDQMLDLLDGLILAGGSDLDPASYGQEPHPETAGYDIERDETDWRWSPGRSSETCRCSESVAGCRS